MSDADWFERAVGPFRHSARKWAGEEVFNWMRNKRMFVLMIVFILLSPFWDSHRRPEEAVVAGEFRARYDGLLPAMAVPAGRLCVEFFVHDLSHMREVYKENEMLASRLPLMRGTASSIISWNPS